MLNLTYFYFYSSRIVKPKASWLAYPGVGHSRRDKNWEARFPFQVGEYLA
uniref:Uncharacterized protein n=1 Tax=Utricularia reniformis TaxID=192314 RepID=A0A1Y0B1C6_9LAMI|nr:hypothetical protein AEK19_MT1030 [Utricularia reniformis]ART31252.1 hypothetical protein AEK19_MT1030 [Utricularia reniformis]